MCYVLALSVLLINENEEYHVMFTLCLYAVCIPLYSAVAVYSQCAVYSQSTPEIENFISLAH